jgi:hypothetical protein
MYFVKNYLNMFTAQRVMTHSIKFWAADGKALSLQSLN